MIGESSQSARPVIQACLVRPRLMAALDADDDDASRSGSPPKVLKRVVDGPPHASETHLHDHKLIEELDDVVQERDTLLEERRRLEELLNASVSEAAALRQRLVESDALMDHTARGREAVVATVDAATAAERLSLQLLTQETELVKLQAAKLAAPKVAHTEQEASAVEEAVEAAEKASSRCATFGRAIERLERNCVDKATP